MPLKITSQDHEPSCLFSEWEVEDSPTFVKALAWSYLRKPHHADRIINDLEPGVAGFFGNVVQNAIDLLRYDTSDIDADLLSEDDVIKDAAEKKRDARIAHRDGLLFQHISWIACRLQFPTATATPAHVRKADKGFDGFLIELDGEQEGLSRVVLCEDKASTNPRALVTSRIWPEIRSIVARERDLEILDALSALLTTLPEEQRESIITSTVWERARCFRVAVTASPDQMHDGSYTYLFEGFDQQAAGDISSRRGDVLPLDDVRAALETLAGEVIAELEQMDV